MYAGLHSWSFRERFREGTDFTIFQAVDLTAQMGFSSLEILTGAAGRPPEHVGTDDPQDLRRLVRYAREQGVRIHCFSTYNDFAFLGPWRDDNIAYILRWIELAAAEVPNLRLLTGYYQECSENAAPQLERQKELTLVGLRAVLPAAEKAGVNLALENHSSVYLYGDQIADLIRICGSPRLTACPDPTNGFDVFQENVPQDLLESMYHHVSAMAPYMTNAHLKIRGLSRYGELLGMDLQRLLRIYQRAGYTGPNIHFESITDGDLLAILPAAKKALEVALLALSHESPTAYH